MSLIGDGEPGESRGAERAASASAPGRVTFNRLELNRILNLYGRMVARYMSRHLPGRPNIITQNMPGAGSVKAAQYLYSIAPKDGTVFGLIMPGALVDPLATDPAKYRYEASRFEYIGTADSGTRAPVGR